MDEHNGEAQTTGYQKATRKHVLTSKSLFSQWFSSVPVPPWFSSSIPSRMGQLKCFLASSWKQKGRHILLSYYLTSTITPKLASNNNLIGSSLSTLSNQTYILHSFNNSWCV